MAVVASRRSVMTLFTDSSELESHRVRIVVAEKGINVEIQETSSEQLPEDVIDQNPYNALPTLVDRDLVLYEPQVIMEYLDERFPHPPLMPVDPVSRAEKRLLLHRIMRDWDGLLPIISGADKKAAENARKELRDSLTTISPIFDQKPFFLSDELTLVDCATAALLWRLPSLDVDLPAQAKGLLDYSERMFSRDSFVESLTEAERELR